MRPLGFREAAESWGDSADPELAFRLHALIGGAAEYKDRCGGAAPSSLADVHQWVRLRVLNPASAMFRAGGLLLSEEPSIIDPASSASALGAIVAGAVRPSEIAAALGRPASAVADLLTGLAGIGLIEQLTDPLDGGRSVCVIVKPIVRLYQLVIAPYEPELAAGQADRVWARSQGIVAARIYRPHFESVARQWCLRHAAEKTIGGVARAVRPTGIGCREHNSVHELNAVVVEDPVATGGVTSVGEANPTDGPMDVRHLRRLEHLRGLLPGDRVGQPPKLLLFSAAGFTAALAEEAAPRADVELVGLDRIYLGG